jgi:hypothetical protein
MIKKGKELVNFLHCWIITHLLQTTTMFKISVKFVKRVLPAVFFLSLAKKFLQHLWRLSGLLFDFDEVIPSVSTSELREDTLNKEER